MSVSHGENAGLESGLQDAVGIALQLVVLAFIVGLLVVARRADDVPCSGPCA